jgi:hypothetical protein
MSLENEGIPPARRKRGEEFSSSSHNHWTGEHPFAFIHSTEQYRNILAATPVESPQDMPIGTLEQSGGANESVLPGLTRSEIPPSLLPAFNSPAAQPTLRDLQDIFQNVLADPTNPHTLSQARADLRTLGPQAAPFLVAALNSDDFHVRELSQEALRSFGSRALDPIIRAYLDSGSSVEIQQRTVQLLTSEESMTAVVAQLSSSNPQERDLARRALASLMRITGVRNNVLAIMDRSNLPTGVATLLRNLLLDSSPERPFVLDGQNRIRLVGARRPTYLSRVTGRWAWEDTGQWHMAIDYNGNQITRITFRTGVIIEQTPNGRIIERVPDRRGRLISHDRGRGPMTLVPDREEGGLLLRMGDGAELHIWPDLPAGAGRN